MFSFVFGVVITAIFYTFWPKAAVVPSAWLQKTWLRIKYR